VLDEDVRAACTAHLSVLVAEVGEDIPYAGGLARGFPFGGSGVPFPNYQKGIYRARVQSGPAALSIQTSSQSPYDDEILADGFLYAYRAGVVDQPDNRCARRTSFKSRSSTSSGRPGWYKPIFPCYVREDRLVERMVLVTLGELVGALDDPIPVPLEEEIDRRYAVGRRESDFTRPACGVAAIHHRAFDQNLVGVSPGYVLHVSRRLREDEDGPMPRSGPARPRAPRSPLWALPGPDHLRAIGRNGLRFRPTGPFRACPKRGKLGRLALGCGRLALRAYTGL